MKEAQIVSRTRALIPVQTTPPAPYQTAKLVEIKPLRAGLLIGGTLLPWSWIRIAQASSLSDWELRNQEGI